MPLWHRYPWLAYAAVFTGVVGHASSEFVSVLTGLAGPETSVWRFTLGGAGLFVVDVAWGRWVDLSSLAAMPTDAIWSTVLVEPYWPRIAGYFRA